VARGQRRHGRHVPEEHPAASRLQQEAAGERSPRLEVGSQLVFANAAHCCLVEVDRRHLEPTAADVPTIEVDRLEHPSPVTPLGAKGVGEGGSIPGPAAVANAVEDALAPCGVVIRSLPITPEQVWRWLRAAPEPDPAG
jgi:CO/xanthine dehydrogenase Mo-binding subunit